ncbi:MAG: YdeI/OmpD-associated family protein [Lapillicoccus sp.]
MQPRRFTVTIADGGRGRLLVPVPFDPDAEWGPKPRHPVRGTVDGARVRGVVESHDGTPGFLLGAAWVRDRPIMVGDQVSVEIEPEGPQRDDLADDIVAALEANPQAARFFDGLAQFYRRAYLRWVDSTKRSPELRQQRIAAMVELLEAGVKDHRAGPQSRAGSSST